MDPKTGRERATIILSVVVVLAAAVIATIIIYQDRIAPMNEVVLEVNGTSLDMRYFLKRILFSGESTMSTLSILTREQIIKLSAGNPPFNITVSDDDVDTYGKTLARGASESISDAEYREWYRQQLQDTRLTDAEFRDLLTTGYLSMAMSEHLAGSISPVADQVFVNLIFVRSVPEGTEVIERFRSGEEFAALALEYSLDPAPGAAGGQLGWFPRGVLDPNLDNAVFGLEVGDISDPVVIDEQRIALVMVSDTARARAIDPVPFSVLQSKALDSWYAGVYTDFNVQYHGLANGYDAETDAWVRQQLNRMLRRKK